MKKLIFVWTLLFTTLAIPVFAGGEYDYKSQEFKEVASQIMCMCGCGQDHFECNMQGCGLNDAFKAEMKDMMDEGMDKDEIRDHYVNIFGEEILTAPEKRGFSLVAWVLPFIVLGGSGTGIFFALRKWIASNASSLNRTSNPLSAKDETEDEIVKSIIDEERKKFY